MLTDLNAQNDLSVNKQNINLLICKCWCDCLFRKTCICQYLSANTHIGIFMSYRIDDCLMASTKQLTPTKACRSF